jgi:hypothetical protein
MHRSGFKNDSKTIFYVHREEIFILIVSGKISSIYSSFEFIEKENMN